MLLAACVSGGAEKPSPPLAPLPEAIATAKTRADHEALAWRFEQEADRLQALSEQHLVMAGVYEGLRPSAFPSRIVMAKHCRRLADNYRTGAEDTRVLAKSHREMARQLSP